MPGARVLHVKCNHVGVTDGGIKFDSGYQSVTQTKSGQNRIILTKHDPGRDHQVSRTSNRLFEVFPGGLVMLEHSKLIGHSRSVVESQSKRALDRIYYCRRAAANIAFGEAISRNGGAGGIRDSKVFEQIPLIPKQVERQQVQ